MSNNKSYNPVWFFIAAIVTLSLWVLNYLYASSLDKLDERGVFGDMFGAVNSIFSGFAFLGVFISVILQRDQLLISREEIQETKKILAKQQDNIEAQNIATQKQMFETTFFNLFETFTNVVEQITINQEVPKVGRFSITSGREFKGKEAIVEFVDQINVNMVSFADAVYNKRATVKSFQTEYDVIFRRNSHNLGHYFRTLYTLLKFVDEQCPTDKFFYAKLVRAQLTNAEATLLALNSLSLQTTPQMNALIVRYRLCKNAEPDRNRALNEISSLLDEGILERKPDNNNQAKQLVCRWETRKVPHQPLS